MLQTRYDHQFRNNIETRRSNGLYDLDRTLYIQLPSDLRHLEDLTVEGNRLKTTYDYIAVTPGATVISL